MKWFLLIIFTLQSALAGFPQGDHEKMFKDAMQFKSVLRTVTATDLDPSMVAYPGEPGDVVLSDDGVYLKADSGTTTNWNNLALQASLAAHLADSLDAHDASAISVVPTVDLLADDAQEGLEELQAEILAHLNDTTDAHDSSAISYNNATSGLTADDAQEAIDEVEGRLDQAELDILDNASDLAAHLADTTDAHDASAISYDNTASGLTADDAQGAIDEVEGRLDQAELDILDNASDIAAHLADAIDAHDASAISTVPYGDSLADDAQEWFEDLQDRIEDLEGLNGLPGLLPKGGLFTSNGTENGYLEVGTNGQILMADSAEDSGIKWTDHVPVASVSGQSGKYLSNNGTTTNWATKDWVTVTAGNGHTRYFRQENTDTEICFDDDAGESLIQYDANADDPYGLYNEGTGTFTADKAGLWCFDAAAKSGEAPAVEHAVYLRIETNGGTVRGIGDRQYVPSANGSRFNNASIHACFILSVGSTVQVHGRISGADDEFDCDGDTNYNYFSGYFVGVQNEYVNP